LAAAAGIADVVFTKMPLDLPIDIRQLGKAAQVMLPVSPC
jgi:hypothetical protein